ncbi:MAG: hypothetical protein ACJA2Q_001858 [Pseudohongiellaceae bacterium]
MWLVIGVVHRGIKKTGGAIGETLKGKGSGQWIKRGDERKNQEQAIP